MSRSPVGAETVRLVGGVLVLGGGLGLGCRGSNRDGGEGYFWCFLVDRKVIDIETAISWKITELVDHVPFISID